MAFFPVSPVNGQQANVGNITYQFNSTANAWNRVGTTVTQLVDGITLNITGNINATGTGQQTFLGRISTGGNVAATGNILGSHMIASGTIAATGNITGGNLTTTGTATTTLLTVATQISIGSSTFTPTQLATYNVVASNAVNSPYGALTTVISSNVITNNINSATGTFTGLVTATAGTTVTGNSNVIGNVNSSQNITAGANITASGNISGTYILGNGAFLTGVTTSGGGGGGGAGSRANVTVGTGSIANAVTTTTNAVMAKGYAIYKISTSVAAWVRVYTSTTTMAADSGRSITTDPQPGAGVIAEAITTGANVVLMSPATVGFNDNATVSSSIPVSITNLSGSSANVQVTFTYLGLES
jgi:hypothetical protein